jgi:hypothetical protein
MNAQITSFTSQATYGLVIDETTGQATDCKCNDRYYRKQYKASCKHMNAFNVAFEAEVERAATFLALKAQVQGMEETARCYREMQYDPRFA